MMSSFRRVSVVFGLFLLTAQVAGAQVDRTPDLGTTVPASWSVDRQAPGSFGLVNGFQGRNDVLRIGVNPAGPTSGFYATQGMQIGIDPTGVPGAGSQKITFDLWLEESWATKDQGESTVATSMWTRLNQVGSDAEGTAYYNILKFTNEGGVGMAQYWNSTVGWTNLAVGLNYGAWNNFELEFNGNQTTARVNGQVVGGSTAGVGATRLTTAYMQVHNVGDTATYHWSNASTSVVPEPSTYALMAAGLAGLGLIARRRRAA